MPAGRTVRGPGFKAVSAGNALNIAAGIHAWESALLLIEIQDMYNSSVKPKTVLSRTALLVLGIIGQEPINPYAIVLLLNRTRTHTRRKVHAQTVYSIINNLSEKKLITGKKQSNGNMPDKTIYSITEKGHELVRKNLLSFLSAPEDNLSELALSVMLVGLLDKNSVIQALYEYREKAGEEIKVRKKLHLADIGDTYIQKITTEHTLNILEVNYNTAGKLIRWIEEDSRWSNLSIPWWRNEISKDKV